MNSPRHILREGGKLKPGAAANFVQSFLYGIINSIINVPCMYGYAAIIYRNPSYLPYMPSLAKLLLFSSAVHQVVFTIFSSLDFAIGQVQDAGLIFLCSMATGIAVSLSEKGASNGDIVATATVTIALATAVLGLVLVAIGRFRLASLVAYLPMPVIGGYLAFIGFFCLEAGLSLCANVVVADLTQWGQLLHKQQIIWCIPGVLGGLVLLLVSRFSSHYAALPGVMLLMPVVFYIVAIAYGYTFEDLREKGWLQALPEEAPFYDLYSLYDVRRVHWEEIPKQILIFLAMTFVVAFSSCLDVAAIETDMGKQLDINHELKTVGLSNFLSGVMGGYTGSYIFSQTIFTYRTKTNSRVVGWVVAAFEFALVILPVSLPSYVPNFFFGATLIFIAFDLMIEWLIQVSWKLLMREYIVLLATFFAINFLNIELGMFIGVCVAAANFIIGYGRVQSESVTYVPELHSSVVRNLNDRVILALVRDQIVPLQLKGYIFFGSSLRLMENVKRYVKVWTSPPPLTVYPRSSCAVLPGTERSPFGASPNNNNYGSVNNRSPSSLNNHSGGGGGAAGCGEDAPELIYLNGDPVVEGPDFVRTRFLVLDFSHVTGIDATSVRSCFFILKGLCAQHGITLVLTSLLPTIEKLLRANNFLPSTIHDDSDFTPDCVLFPDIDSGLDFCESMLVKENLALIRRGRASGDMVFPGFRPRECQGGRNHVLCGTPSDILQDYLRVYNASFRHAEPHQLHPLLLNHSHGELSLEGIDEWLEQANFSEGEIIFRPGDPPTCVYLLLAGEVGLYYKLKPTRLKTTTPRQIAPSKYSAVALEGHRLLMRVRSGCLFGDVSFYLEEPRDLLARANAPCQLHFLTREAHDRMTSQNPRLAAAFEQVIVKALSLSVSNHYHLSIRGMHL